jgi:hydrogenase maturation protease
MHKLDDLEMDKRILVAGIGNIFLGDDAFGVEVIRQMAGRKFPAGVRVVDFGIRGLDLTYALLEEYDAAIVVDAMPRGQAPGTLYVIEPEAPDPAPSGESPENDLLIETHGMHPAKVLRLVAAMGGKLRQVLVVGCEPMPFDPEVDMEMKLSAPVAAAIPEAIKMIESLVEKFLSDDQNLVPQSKGANEYVSSNPCVAGGHGRE